MDTLAEREVVHSKQIISGDELLAMGDLGPCELIEGKIVPMSPTKMKHGRYEYRLARLIGDFVEEHDLGVMMTGEVGIYVRRNPDTIRAADVIFISHERLAQAASDSFLDVPPELVAEILSPSDRWSEVRRKLRDYFAAGVDVVLVVEPADKIVSVYRAPTTVDEFREADTLALEEILPGLRLPVAEIFAAR